MQYLKYAFGEIILVVIGILIALSINNWNENRKERVQETLILQQLLSDFTSNLEQLDQKMSFRKDFMKSLKNRDGHLLFKDQNTLKKEMLNCISR